MVAKHAFPEQTVPEVRVLTGYPERTIYEWMAGRTEPPAGVMLQLFGEISRDTPEASGTARKAPSGPL